MDEVFEAEQAHLNDTYAKLEAIERASQHELSHVLRDALGDKESLLDELALNKDSDIHVETMVEYEAMNRIIDQYNLHADVLMERLRTAQMLKRQPYFAKISLQFKRNAPARDIYIGSAGMTDENRRHFIVDWRSPVAEIYYNQENGQTSYEANGRTIEVNLQLRRQFDIEGPVLNAYFDTTVAIQDALLLASLAKNRSAHLKAITTTIQKEQNAVIRHKDVDALIAAGIAGSGKTSVLLQRIAYLFYRERETLKPDDVCLITPNRVFKSYIENVLPEMGESNPQTITWAEFMEKLGLESRALGETDSAETLERIDAALGSFKLTGADFADIRVDNEIVVTANQAQGLWDKFKRFETGAHRSALVADELAERLEQRIKRLAKSERHQAELLDLDDEEQIEIFGRYISPQTDDEVARLTEQYLRARYAHVPDMIEDGAWLRIDRIGMRLLGVETLSAVQWLYLKLALAGGARRNVRYVLIDEVQDYTLAQLMVLIRYFCNARFLMLGDENQAIAEHTASFSQIRALFESCKDSVDTCELMTSYRSTPQITALFASLLDSESQLRAQSVQPDGTAPRAVVCKNEDEYASALSEAVEQAQARSQLIAVICSAKHQCAHVESLLSASGHGFSHNGDTLRDSGLFVLDVAHAKGLEFDEVIVADAQVKSYPETALARHRLYTAISRATRHVTLIAQGPLSRLIDLSFCGD